MHPFSNYAVCRNDFFKNPYKVLELFNKQKFSRSPLYPGIRTENLFKINDKETQDFAIYFANRIKADVFPGIQKFMIDIRLHINDVYEDCDANQGWIHSDEANLAGIVYLTPGEINFSNGTSIFNKVTTESFSVEDFDHRHKFNLYQQLTDEYLLELKENWKHFEESIKFGNEFNRLVAYDAKLFHRPNSFTTNTKESRKSIVFFIQDFACSEFFDESKFNWKDQ
jgi:hypothetical protein